ncbi:hypothetical protein MTO96_051503 [Rhipicephalus appendiculatus]
MHYQSIIAVIKAKFLRSSTVLELILRIARALENPLPMAEKYVLMRAILIVIIVCRTSGYLTCQGREKQCGPDRRPNCLEKNHQPYIQCTLKRQPCEDAWLSCCKPPNALTCHYGPTYCDCYCRDFSSPCVVSPRYINVAPDYQSSNYNDRIVQYSKSVFTVVAEV